MEPIEYQWDEDIYQVTEALIEFTSSLDLNFYKGHDGSIRKWKYTDSERPDGCCYDCKIPYGTSAFGDLVLPEDTWAKINPTYHKDAGLLCPRCIFERLAVLGLSVESGVKIYPSSK